MRKTQTILGAAALAGIIAATASAHSKATAYGPEDGATVTELSEITMGFDEPMRIISVDLTRDGAPVPLERETGTDPVTEFVARPGEAPEPGSYAVEWRGMSSDGHPMQGSFGFTLAE